MINTTASLLNRLGVSGESRKTPYEVWLNKKPSLKPLRIIRSVCYAHIPKQFKNKMDKKATKRILIAYDNDECYCIWCKEFNRLMRSLKSIDSIIIAQYDQKQDDIEDEQDDIIKIEKKKVAEN